MSFGCRDDSQDDTLAPLYTETNATCCRSYVAAIVPIIAIKTRLHQFARSLLYNATAGGALW